MSSTKGLYDDPAFLEKVYVAFTRRMKKWDELTLARTKVAISQIRLMWEIFKEGVEYGYGLDRDEETDLERVEARVKPIVEELHKRRTER